MRTSPSEFFASQFDIETDKELLCKDINEIEQLIDQALDKSRNPVIGSVRYADNFVEIKFTTPVALVNTPLLPRYLKTISEDLRLAYRAVGWDDLTMTITFIASDTTPLYEFVVKLTYR